MLFLTWRCELHVVTLAKGPLRFSIQRDAVQSPCVIADSFTTLAFHRHAILFLVQTLDSPIFSRFDAKRLAASRVTHNIAQLVLAGPLPVRSRNLLPRYKHVILVFLLVYLTLALHGSMNRLVYLSARLIVGRHYQRAFRLRCVLARDFG